MTDQPTEAATLAIFGSDDGDVPLSVDKKEETVWATQGDLARLFVCTEENVVTHLKHIYAEGELDQAATTKFRLVVRKEGERRVARNLQHYNLDAILSVGYRINTARATKFRQWASKTLKEYIVNGFAIDKERLAQNPDAHKALAQLLRTSRTSEQNMYQQVRDVFKHAASDYNKDSPAARKFFAMAQDKFHYAVLQKTAAQIVLERASAKKPNMGMTVTTAEFPTLEAARTAKNYLSEDELRALENICEQWLLFAEAAAFRGKTMTMEELSYRLNTLLTANDYPVLYEYGKFHATKRDNHAKTQLTKYRALQDAKAKKALKAPAKALARPPKT